MEHKTLQNQHQILNVSCNALVLGRELARHGASVPLRSPVENRRDTDVSLRHRIGKDDLCNTNMSRQNKNLTTTHSHSRKNARTEELTATTVNKLQDKCWTQVLRTERQQVQVTVPTRRTHPTGMDEEAKGTTVLLHANQTEQGSNSCKPTTTETWWLSTKTQREHYSCKNTQVRNRVQK